MLFKSLLMVAAFAVISFAKTISACAQESNPATEKFRYWQFGVNVGLTAVAYTDESHYIETSGCRFNGNIS